jgi:TonB family protein
MHILFQGGAQPSASQTALEPRAEVMVDQPVSRPSFWAPDFLVELPPWRRTFFHNLRDLLLGPLRPQPPLRLTSQPAPFWTDVFVNRRLPAASFRQSLLCHVLVAVSLWAICYHTPLMRPGVQPQNPLKKFTVVYYPVSEYLPPLNAEVEAHTRPAQLERKGEPVYARQRIISLPRRPDNTSQTIVTPPLLQIRNEVPLPNIVAWTPTPPAVPSAAASAMNSRLQAPPVPVPVAPPPESTRSGLTAPILPAVDPVAPPPAITAASKLPNMSGATAVPPPPAVAAASKLPNLTAPTPIEPPPVVQARLAAPLAVPPAVEPAPTTNQARRLGDLNIARLDTNMAAPRLPVVEQRSAGVTPQPEPGVAAAPLAATVRQLPSAAGRVGAAAINSSIAAPAPPPISAAAIAGMGNTNGAGQVIALGIHPAAPRGPIEIPAGNRRGTFAAGPEGRPDAPGTPDLHGGGKTDGSGGKGSHPSDSPTAGITIAAGAVNPGPMAIATPSVAGANPPPARAPSSNPLLAAMAPARPADLARQTRPRPSPLSPDPAVNEVFGAKRYYSMVLNMPNLTSTGGSWVMRFAELNDNREPGELSPPVAMVKVDPAYPAELMRGRVEGVVLLYAVIRADGSVDQVRVLRGVDERLDSSARAALLKWRFRPAIKHGDAVDLETVVQIPFQSRPTF